jgi:hypothetical protein
MEIRLCSIYVLMVIEITPLVKKGEFKQVG